MARLKKRTDDEIYRNNRVSRGWGYELWIENIPEYCGKILHVAKGKRGSLHFHQNKLETMYLQSGDVQLRFIDTENGQEYRIDLLPGDSIQIPRCQPHQIIGIQDSVIFEFSTVHEESDSKRIQKGD